jgi:hypothetical protein
MHDKQKMIASSQVQTRQTIKAIGRTVIETMITAEDDLLDQGGPEALVQYAILTGTVNALGAYVATRLYPEPDQVAVAAHVQAELQHVLHALLQAPPLPTTGGATAGTPQRTRVA